MNTIERILDLIKKRNITAKKLTQEAGLSSSAITDWKNEKANPSYGSIIKIANYFDINPDYLLCKTDNPTPPGKGIQSETEQNPLINKILKVLPNPTNEEFEKLIDYARYIDSSRDE